MKIKEYKERQQTNIPSSNYPFCGSAALAQTALFGLLGKCQLWSAMKTSTVKARKTHDTRDRSHGDNDWMIQEAVLPAFVRTIAHSLGERALIVCLARQKDFSEMMSLVAHPEAKYGLALRLRTLCRRTLPLGSSLHRILCWQLLKHRLENVRDHIRRLVRYEGQMIWRARERADSEITNESTAGGRDGQHWAECRCDPVREIVEEEMLPCLSNVLGQEELRRWLLPLRNTVWICRCGGFYKHIGRRPCS